MGIARYRLLVSGQVQGVGYRISARNVADNLKLTGWVKNLTDGQVEIAAEGEAGTLRELVTWAKQGPRFADVKDVIVTQHNITGEFDNFIIR